MRQDKVCLVLSSTVMNHQLIYKYDLFSIKLCIGMVAKSFWLAVHTFCTEIFIWYLFILYIATF